MAGDGTAVVVVSDRVSQEAGCSIFLDGEGALFKWLELVNTSLMITKNFTGPHVSVKGYG